MREQLRLTDAGIEYSLNIILGCGGAEHLFRECTFGQLPDEQGRLIGGLDLKDTIYFGSHPSNIVPMQGRLPKRRRAMIEAVREKREQLRRHPDEYPQRGGEGSIQNRYRSSSVWVGIMPALIFIKPSLKIGGVSAIILTPNL